MTSLSARPAGDEVHRLGEGPVWDAASDRLLWVDIETGDVLRGELDGDRVRVIDRINVDRTVGAVVPAGDGRLLIAGADVVHVLEPDGSRREMSRVLPQGSGRRLNDGACDPAGRFLVGTLSLGASTGRETLHRIEDDGSLTTLDDDLTLSNGLAWSPDGTVLYSVDTLAGVVRARPYDPATGATGRRSDLLHVEPGLPDGMRVDTDGNLWVAIWGGGQVRCTRPDGTLLHVVDVPAPNVTAVAFAGPDLGTVVITTASVGLGDGQLAAFPASGRMFAVEVGDSLGVHGLATTRWNGLPLSHASRRTDPAL
jgi:sugar lactone lactonase YvrE